MGDITDPKPVVLIIAVISRFDEAFDFARRWAISQFGPIQLQSQQFEFVETDYYQSTMGEDLKKTFLAFESLVSPEVLAMTKVLTNEAERAFAAQHPQHVARPLNLDPGLISESKLILASTKDHAHRIYLNKGIFAELTLQYRRRAWQPMEWTYPDYRRPDFQEFFTACREYLRRAHDVG